MSILTVLAAVLASLEVASPALAAFPGANGRIGYSLEEYPTLSDAESYYWLRTILPDGTEPRSLGRSAWGPVAFSPDGRRVAYVDGYDASGVWVAPVSGRRGSRRLTRGVDDEVGDWSPTGRRFVFTRSPDDGPTALWIHYFKGTRRLVEGTDPAWSVRGDIAYTAAGGIQVIRPDGSRLRRISERGGSPDWSPDGRRIVFTVGSRIALIRADGSGFRWLPATGAEPAFSPDGKQIVFVRNSAIFKMTSAGRRVKRLRSHFRYGFEDFGTVVYGPDWQPRPARRGDAGRRGG